jgi:hypothetical protein
MTGTGLWIQLNYKYEYMRLGVWRERKKIRMWVRSTFRFTSRGGKRTKAKVGLAGVKVCFVFFLVFCIEYYVSVNLGHWEECQNDLLLER